MDQLVKRWDAVRDGDLMISHAHGLAYQTDMSFRAAPGVNAEGNNYFDHYAAMDESEIARKIYAGRVAMVDKYAGKECPVLDMGIGSGQFIRSRPNTFGMDVNPKALEWLKQNNLAAPGLDGFSAYTFWDVLEHVDVPNNYFKRMEQGSFLFTSLPIFDDLSKVRESKHYKPGEHLYYWTEKGFVDWMAEYRFRLIERSSMEIEAGRESIVAFAFVRDLPGYRDTVDQYRKMHSAAYGTTAYLYFNELAKAVIGSNAGSILDFGCGRSDLVAHFWNEGRRRIAKYDPAIPQFEQMPEGEFDLAICCDVMEHIPMLEVDRVFDEIKAKARRALFTISMRPARARLPDGRNAHVTLLTESEWLRWIRSRFGLAEVIQHERADHIVMVRTW
jgi:hypothetical protein